MVRLVRGAGGEIEEEGLLRGHRVGLFDPVSSIVDQIRGEVIALRGRGRWLDSGGVAVQPGMPLAIGAAHEAVVILESQAGGPVVEWAGCVGFPNRRVVPFSECRRAIAVELQALGDRGGALRPDGVVTRISGGAFYHHAETDFMIVAAGEQRGARRRA